MRPQLREVVKSEVAQGCWLIFETAPSPAPLVSVWSGEPYETVLAAFGVARPAIIHWVTAGHTQINDQAE